MIFIMFFHFAIGITDVYVAGYLGKEVLAAVGYVGQLYWTMMILANGVTVGTVSMVSQAQGAGSSEGVGTVTAHSLLMGTVVAGALTIPAAMNPEAIVRYSGMPQEIRDIAAVFVQVFALVLIPTYLMIISAGVLRASNRVKLAMVNSFIAALVNVIGDFALTFGWGPIPAMGFRGIAYASAISTTVGMTLNLICVLRGPARFGLAALLGPIPRCMKNLVKLGIPSAIQNTAWNAGTLVVYFLVGNLQAGEVTALAAMTGGLRVEAIIFLPIFAFNMAAAIMTGNRLGKGDVEGARFGAKTTALLCLVIILVPSGAIFALASTIASVLTDEPAVIAEMARYLRINMIAMPFMAVGVTLGGVLQGAGDTLGTMRNVFLGMWLIRIPMILSVMYVFTWGSVGIWWAMTASMIALCGLMIYRFSTGVWTTASVDKQSNTLLWEACLPRTPGS